MRVRDLPIVAFDTETTGLDPFLGDRVIEFAAIRFQIDEEGRITEKKADSWLIQPGVPIPRKVTEITGISDMTVANSPRFEDVAGQIHDLLTDCIVVAHNLPFDLGFMSEEFREVGLHWPDPYAEVDTLDLSQKLFKEARGHKLSDLCERVGVTLGRAHRATDDATATGECFVELLRRSDVGDDLDAMIAWANGVGRPPLGGGFTMDDDDQVVFAQGPHEGTPIRSKIQHLTWMTLARVKTAEGWRFRFPEPTRAWIQRWLDHRTTGRDRQGAKGWRSEDWGLDPILTLDRKGRALAP